MREKKRRGDYAEQSRVVPIRAAPPFFFSRFASRVHRIRSAEAHYWGGAYTHTSFHLWCGQSGFLDNKKHKHNLITADPPGTFPICGTCEGRARGYGQLGSHLIAGRMVTFTPQTI